MQVTRLFFPCLLVLEVTSLERLPATLWPNGNAKLVKAASHRKYRERLESLNKFCESGTPDAELVKKTRTLHLTFSSKEFKFYGCMRPKVSILDLIWSVYAYTERFCSICFHDTLIQSSFLQRPAPPPCWSIWRSLLNILKNHFGGKQNQDRR